MRLRTYHLTALSALHCGTGQSAGVIDLPIARARATNIPIVPGSSLRGVLRERIEQQDDALAPLLFGPATITSSENSHAGALSIGDAHLLTLPVRSLAGIVCHVTCPYVLKRYARDMQAGGDAETDVVVPKDGQALVPETSRNRMDDGVLVLEDLDLTAQTSPSATTWANRIAGTIHQDDQESQTDFRDRFAIIPDTIFGFLCETAMELRTRIRINQETGTVQTGALWFEEHLPSESVLWGVYAMADAMAPGSDRSEDDLNAALVERIQADRGLLQVGGQAGVGRGLVRLTATDGAGS